MGETETASSFNVCFFTVDGEPLTVIGSLNAIEALKARLDEVGADSAYERVLRNQRALLPG